MALSISLRATWPIAQEGTSVGCVSSIASRSSSCSAVRGAGEYRIGDDVMLSNEGTSSVSARMIASSISVDTLSIFMEARGVDRPALLVAAVRIDPSVQVSFTSLRASIFRAFICLREYPCGLSEVDLPRGGPTSSLWCAVMNEGAPGLPLPAALSPSVAVFFDGGRDDGAVGPGL